MADKKTIQGIDCYGEFEEDSNVLVCGDYASGMALEDFWCGGEDDKGEPIRTWTGAVKELKAWADREGHTIYELSAC